MKPTFGNWLGYLLGVYLFNVAWCLFVLPFLVPPDALGAVSLPPDGEIWIRVAVMAPIFEEMEFRLLAVGLLLLLFGRDNLVVWLSVVFLSGAVFGLMHGNLANLLAQGVLGLTLGWLFVKNFMAFRRNGRISGLAIAYLTCIMGHVAHNVTMLMLAGIPPDFV